MEQRNVTPIHVPFPKAESLHLRLSVGACRLEVKPGDGEAWIDGAYYDPSNALPCKIDQDGGTVHLTQDYRVAEWWGLFGGNIPHFMLQLGKAVPYTLTLEVGASESRFDLGGLPITRLVARQGAGKMDFSFSAPNPQPMSLLELNAGAVGIDMRSLANANFAEMRVEGGAAAFKFDFGGTFQREARVSLTTGMAGLDVYIPAATSARVTSETILGGVDVGNGFTKKEGAFWTSAGAAGQTPLLDIVARVSLGGLTLRTT